MWRPADEADFVYADEHEWWETLWGHGTRASLEQMSPRDLAAFQAEAFQRIQSVRQSDGFHFMLGILCGLASKPTP